MSLNILLFDFSIYYHSFLFPVLKNNIFVLEKLRYCTKFTMIFIIFFIHKKNYSISAHVALFLSSPVRFLHPPKTRWYVRFNEKGVVRDRNGTRMRSQLLQRAAVDDIRGNIKSVMQEGWFRPRKGSSLKPRLPTLDIDAICLFLDREYLLFWQWYSMLQRYVDRESIPEVVAKYSAISTYLILIILKRFVIYPRSLFAQQDSKITSDDF